MTTTVTDPTAFSSTVAATGIELSVVMPCLNEADTLATCIRKAKAAIASLGDSAEIVIADNGSTDGSQQIASDLGVRVVPISHRGYGNALMGGIAAARGRFVIMGDADDSYDFGEIPKFLTKLREGFDIVQGCRLPSGGGTVAPGAMPLLHRWWGNPMFSMLARWWFGAPIHDVYCGMRGFTKSWYEKLDQQCTGMEFATEMIIKSSLFGARMGEVPITLHLDGRKAHAPHLKTFRDGWRTLRFFLIFSPKWLFLVPGIFLMLIGLMGYALAMPGIRLFGAQLDAHTLLVASLAMIVGYQSIFFAVFTKVFATSERLRPADPRMDRFFKVMTLERGVISGALACIVGVVLVFVAAAYWKKTGFGALNYARTMRWVVPGITLFALGFQTIWSSFFVSILGMRRK